ncbi:hypothetical protein FS837_006848, partial [Tulasnella sp. UAMH 9824]
MYEYGYFRTYFDKTFALKKQDYRVDAAKSGVFETTSSMLKERKPGMDAMEVALDDSASRG